jgi:hypothetical protein
LTQVGVNYFLDNTGSGTGPELKYNGAAVTAGEFGTWTPIGAVQVTGGGYDVAWHDTGSGLYTAWSVDSNGNYLSNLIGAVSGTSSVLESLETTFNQDLNGDGTIGIPKVVVQTDGSTALTQVGVNYFLDNTGSGTGPELKYNGAAVTVGEFGTWTPIGAVQVTGGDYDVAWHDPGSGQYTVWSTDSNGNYLSNVIGAVSGSSTALESLETTFNQDLNGDGTIGIPAATSPGTSAAPAANSGSTTFDGTTLSLAGPSTFHGQIIGFTGDGTSAGSDQIDLRGVSYNLIHSSFDASTGTLAVSDNSTTSELQFLGHYSQNSFQFADDGKGGTLILGSTGQLAPQGGNTAIQVGGNGGTTTSTTGEHDSFVFAPNFGQATLANFNPATDTIQISQSVFANMTALLSATHDDGHGNAVITEAAHDTITIQNVTTAQLLAHQSDFHFV